MQEKSKYLTKVWKSFYDALSENEKRQRLSYLKRTEPKGDKANHEAKIKALEELL
jgi:hypothetical protein